MFKSCLTFNYGLINHNNKELAIYLRFLFLGNLIPHEM